MSHISNDVSREDVVESSERAPGQAEREERTTGG